MSTAGISYQFLRKAQVIVGSNGQGLLVDQLRVQFLVTKTVDSTPNSALIKIFNLNPNNEALVKNEYDEVILNAGYQDSIRLIFRGNIRHVSKYRQGNDWITEIDAGDGDTDHRQAVMNETISAGSTDNDLITQAVKSFSTTVKGFIGLTNDKPRPRGRTVSGNTRQVLNAIAKTQGVNWSIQDGQLQMVSVDSIMPGQAIVVNSQTGMLSAPEVSDKGISVKCLLNPQFMINGAIQLDNNDIKLKIAKQKASHQKTASKTALPNLDQGIVRLDPDGIYKIINIKHSGDNRGTGNDWVSDLICVGLSQPIPATGRT